MSVNSELNAIFLGAFLVFGGACFLTGCDCVCENKVRTESMAISGDAKKWLLEKIGGTERISVGGLELIMDKQIERIKSAASRTENTGEIMIYGNAIDALEKERECVRRMGEPVKCLGSTDFAGEGK